MQNKLETKPSEMSDSLLRQRRNLIITSLILIGFLYAEIEITKISIFSIDFKTTRPNSVIEVLWIFWVYFLIRYY